MNVLVHFLIISHCTHQSLRSRKKISVHALYGGFRMSVLANCAMYMINMKEV